ncbi:MAG: NAD-dependent epimerase/dehydratase family protein [Dehalococcoidia bacterium]|nr:NAD-dependent epimerase/dehydratase family protein [Dehalococcoidia bacterium]
MTVLVTGATGFIGSNLVRELLADGETVRVLARPASDRTALSGLHVELAEGDLRDAASLREALQGCREAYHAGAHYVFWPPDHRLTHQVNVLGTRAFLTAARETGVRRVVYTSSSGTIGLPKDGTPGNESTPVRVRDMQAGYKRSKYLAEQEALRANGNGLEVVIVNPTTPMGPWDVKPTPTGRIVVEVLRGRMSGYVDTGLNIVHVRDVARGHIQAMRRGKPGERYLLGNRNMSLLEICQSIARIAGCQPPRRRIPYLAALLYACAEETVTGRLLRRTPRVTVAEVKLSRKHMYFDSSRAVQELGLPQTPPEQAFADAITWCRAHGYA